MSLSGASSRRPKRLSWGLVNRVGASGRSLQHQRRVYGKTRRMECARILTGDVSIRLKELGIIRPIVTIAVVADGIYFVCLEGFLRAVRATIAAEVPSYVEELHTTPGHLFPGPLANIAQAGTRIDIGDFEFLPITVPLIIGFIQWSEGITGIKAMP